MTIAGKITIFNSLAFSKIIFVTYLTAIPEKIVKQIEIIQNEFVWDGKKPSVIYLTMNAGYADSGLKMIHVTGPDLRKSKVLDFKITLMLR